MPPLHHIDGIGWADQLRLLPDFLFNGPQSAKQGRACGLGHVAQEILDLRFPSGPEFGLEAVADRGDLGVRQRRAAWVRWIGHETTFVQGQDGYPQQSS
jgi:hypothetical protein